MKPQEIFSVLDLTMKIRENGDIFNPLFTGSPGVGKSQIVQAWAKKNNLPFIDLRVAFLEAPDLIGFPTVTTVNDRQVTTHNIPEFLPHTGKGVLLLEEVNRGTVSVTNCLMMLLTDRALHKYTLPDGWIIVSCINEGSDFDVNNMDPALKNRFQMFNVNYDKPSFVRYMKDSNWDKYIIMFVESNSWTYKSPEDMGDVPGSKYISPRTLAALNALLNVDRPKDEEMERMLYQTVLGNNVGRDFYSFKHNESPVLYSHLVENTKFALNRLKTFSNPEKSLNGMISITTQDIVEDGTISDELLIEVCLVLPVDSGPRLISDLEFKRKDDTILKRLCDQSAAMKDLFKATLKQRKK